MKIKIIQIGKNKDQVIDAQIKKFVKRISPFAQIEIMTLKEISPSKTFTKEKCMEEEGVQILKQIEKSEDYIVVLDEKGRQFTSIEFSGIIQKNKDLGRNITFIIGGPFGLSPEVKNNADLNLSLSKMTFTHQMVRIFLLEQVYRTFTIIFGKEYHNE